MTAVIIVLSVITGFLIILSLLLSFPIRLTVNTSFDKIMTVKYLFLEFPKDKKPEKKKKQKKKTDKKRDTDKKKKSKKQKKKLSYYIEKYKDPIISVIKSLGKLTEKIEVKYINLDARVCGENAAATAIEYGAVTGGIYTALGFIDRYFTVKEKNITVNPDFLGSESEFLFSGELRLRPIYAIATVITLLKAVNTISNK